MLEEDNDGTDKGWRGLILTNKTSLRGCKVDTLVMGAWHFWQQFCQTEGATLLTRRVKAQTKPNSSQMYFLETTSTPFTFPQQSHSKCKPAPSSSSSFQQCKMEKPHSSVSTEPSLRDKKGTSLSGSQSVGFSLAGSLLLSGGLRRSFSSPFLCPGQIQL